MRDGEKEQTVPKVVVQSQAEPQRLVKQELTVGKSAIDISISTANLAPLASPKINLPTVLKLLKELEVINGSC